MPQFPHLQFVQKIVGKPRFLRSNSSSDISDYNKNNRAGHAQSLTQNVDHIKAEWSATLDKRAEQGLVELDPEVVPVFFKVNPDIITNDFNLQQYGIEVISEEEDGYIIGAAFDELQSLEEKIAGFIDKNHGSGKIAELWEIVEGNREAWKPQRVLSAELLAKWATIEDDINYTVEIGIAFNYPVGAAPDPEKKGGPNRLAKHKQYLEELDDLRMKRENEFDAFLAFYGSQHYGMVDNGDSFAYEVTISGKGLKDLVHNYPYVFEVVEKEEVGVDTGEESPTHQFLVALIPPEPDAIEIGVIDSGMMEGHAYLAPAIKAEHSTSYTGQASTMDRVEGGGHGTKVAGRILYPDGISHLEPPYQLPFFVRNLRVLNDDNRMNSRFPAELMEQIVEEHSDCSIFNLSITSRVPFRRKHMSSWAATIDKLIHEQEVLFVICTGNLKRELVIAHHAAGYAYPDYLSRLSCNVANPAQSSFAIVVGSVNHASYDDEFWASLGGEGDPSGFTRSGPGIWGKIKPDVVDYGGGMLLSKSTPHTLRNHDDVSPELIRSNVHGGGGIGRDIGTSFSAPKITHIIGKIKEIYPDEGPNLLRALLVQSARLPGAHFRSPTAESIAYMGYGIPSLSRVANNSDHRITFYNTGSIIAEEGHIYAIDIPAEIRNPGDEYEVLVEVTLAYSAKVRRTRQQTKSYLGTWLDWIPAKVGESLVDFTNYAMRSINGEVNDYDSDERKQLGIYPWQLRRQDGHGTAKGVHRNNSSLQKDWAIIPSNELPETLSLSVQAHKSWDLKKEPVPYAIVVSIEVLGAELPIYQQISVANQVEIEVE